MGNSNPGPIKNKSMSYKNFFHDCRDKYIGIGLRVLTSGKETGEGEGGK